MASLNRRAIKRLLKDRGISALLADCAAGTGISLSVVKQVYYRQGYGARSDGQVRVVKVNEWLNQEVDRER